MPDFDQALSPRLGQRTSVEATFVRMFAGSEIPEAAWVGQMIYRTDTQGLQVFTEAGAWEDVVGGTAGVLTFVGPSIPTSLNIGDTWFDTDDFHKLYVAKSVGANEISSIEWVLTQDSHSAQVAADAATVAASSANTAALAAMSAADAAQATADGAIRTYYQSSPPWANGSTGHANDAGDMWYDTDDGNAYRWNDSTKLWAPIEDSSIGVALAAAQNAQTTADGKITAYYQITAPAIGEIGDLWYDTDDKNKPYYCSSITPVTWTPVRDLTIADAQATASTAIANAATAQSTADGKVNSYFQISAPTGLVAGDFGDLWFDTDDGYKMYSWDGAAWVLSADTRISSAVSAAAAAQTTANSKIITFYQTSPPTATTIGDLWVDTDDNNKLYRASATGSGSWVTVQDGTIAIAQSTANTALSGVTSLNTAVLPDGLAPASSPTPVVTAGINNLGIRWTAVANHDPVTYEVYCDTTGPTFTPGVGNLQVKTTATSYTITEKTANGTILDKTGTVTYYVRIIARDADGAAAASTAASGIPRLVTTPDVSSDYIYGNYIDAIQITGSTLNADLAIIGKIKTANDGQRVEMTSEGLRSYAPDGRTLRVDLPNDPTLNPRFDGALIADSLTLKNGMELRGINNIFAMGSKSILQTKTVGSASSPSLSLGYPVAGFSFGQWVNPAQGFWANTSESSVRRTTSFYGANYMYKNATYYKRPMITRGDGTEVPDYYLYFGSTAIYTVGGGERLVTIGLDTTTSTTYADDKFFYRVWDDNSMATDGSVAPNMKTQLQDGGFSFFWEWRVGRCFSSSGSARANRFCAVKRNVFNPWPAGSVSLRVHTATDLAISQDLVRNLANDGFLAQDEIIIGVAYGSSARMGFAGTDEDIWVIQGTVNNYVYKDGLTLTRQTFREFPAIPASRTVMACGDLITNDFSYFYAAPANDGPSVYRHTNVTWASGDSPVWWGSYTWHDSVGTQHETDQSVRAQITMKQRSRLSVTVPELPDPAGGKGTTRLADDVNSFRFYLGRGVTDPGRAAMARQTDPTDLATQAYYETVTFTVTTPPPTASDFPDQASASIESNALGTGSFPKIKLSGDGTAHFEALDVGGEGATSLTGKAFEQLFYSNRAQSQLVGGGVKTVDASYNISWSQRFLMISIGRSSNTTASGLFEVRQPGTFNVSNRVLTSNVVTLTCAAHNFRVGNVIEVTGIDATFNGVQTLTSVTSTTVSYAKTNANIASVASGGWVNAYIVGTGTNGNSRAVTSSKVPLNSWDALWYEPPYSRAGEVFAITNKALTSNVATLTVTSHTNGVGEFVTISGVDATFDGSYVVTAVTATTISYSKTNANVASTAATGTLTTTNQATEWNNFRITNYQDQFVVPNNWILLAMRNADNTIVEFATGENVDPGYDSATYNIGGQKIKKMNIGNQVDTTDANGACVYAHGLGQTPTQVLACKAATGGTSYIANVDTFGATTFRVVYRKAVDGTVQASGISVGCFFLAIAE